MAFVYLSKETMRNRLTLMNVYIYSQLIDHEHSTSFIKHTLLNSVSRVSICICAKQQKKKKNKNRRILTEDKADKRVNMTEYQNLSKKNLNTKEWNLSATTIASTSSRATCILSKSTLKDHDNNNWNYILPLEMNQERQVYFFISQCISTHIFENKWSIISFLSV